jgi:hypothetical protein
VVEREAINKVVKKMRRDELLLTKDLCLKKNK